MTHADRFQVNMVGDLLPDPSALSSMNYRGGHPEKSTTGRCFCLGVTWRTRRSAPSSSEARPGWKSGSNARSPAATEATAEFAFSFSTSITDALFARVGPVELRKWFEPQRLIHWRLTSGYGF